MFGKSCISAYEHIGKDKYSKCKTCINRRMYATLDRSRMYDHDSRPDGYLGAMYVSGYKCALSREPRKDCWHYEKGSVDDYKELRKCFKGVFCPDLDMIYMNEEEDRVW